MISRLKTILSWITNPYDISIGKAAENIESPSLMNCCSTFSRWNDKDFDAIYRESKLCENVVCKWNCEWPRSAILEAFQYIISGTGTLYYYEVIYFHCHEHRNRM